MIYLTLGAIAVAVVAVLLWRHERGERERIAAQVAEVSTLADRHATTARAAHQAMLDAEAEHAAAMRELRAACNDRAAAISAAVDILPADDSTEAAAAAIREAMARR